MDDIKQSPTIAAATDDAVIAKATNVKEIRDVLSIKNEAIDDPVHYTNWRALVGFIPEQQALQYIQSEAIKTDAGKQYWLSRIKKANDVVRNISNRANMSPEIRELDRRFESRLEKLKSEPLFAEYLIGQTSHRFALVELAKLHCFQQHLNTEFVDSLVDQAPSPDDLDATVKFCLPLKDEKSKTPVLKAFNSNSNTYAYISDNLDMRILGTAEGEDTATGRKFAGFQYGFGLPALSVVNYKGLYLLKNGYHRAFALYKKGHKFAPCLLVSIESYEHTGAQRPGFFPIDLIMSDKSPILSDFDTDAALLVPRRRMKMMITMHAEAVVVPV
ncbi:MAG: hypothetical protein AB1351_13270 [Thermoproteota archaeon]